MKTNCFGEKVLVVQFKEYGPRGEWHDCSTYATFEALNKAIAQGRFNLKGVRYRVMVRTVVYADVALVDGEYSWEGTL